ncbi:hypothetical protein [Helicobacter muridarum]|nr:hypothetical protein [Helicobacter muridarum]
MSYIERSEESHKESKNKYSQESKEIIGNKEILRLLLRKASE